MMGRQFLGWFILALSCAAHASMLYAEENRSFTRQRLLNEYYTKLKVLPPKMTEDVGKVCEQMAKVALLKRYPTKTYEIGTNFTYFYNRDHHIGELDVVIKKRSSDQVIYV